MRYKKISRITSKEDYLKCYREYNSTMKTRNKNKNKQKRALHVALDIRKFETNLHWKRTIYFWGFISVTFIAYFSVLSMKENIFPIQKEIVLFVVSLFGLFLASCWFCINKMSTYWIRNWEYQVELLEDEIIGPLYKRNIVNTGKECFFIKSSKYSSSAINQLVSFSMIVLWIFISAVTIYELLKKFNIQFENIILLIITAAFIGLFYILFHYCHHERCKSEKSWTIEEREI